MDFPKRGGWVHGDDLDPAAIVFATGDDFVFLDDEGWGEVDLGRDD